MDKEMQRALMLDAEKLHDLTGEDHTPLFLADCKACDGKGYIAKTVHVYEHGCGFSHPDVEETPCQACAGNGWFVCEAESEAVPRPASEAPTPAPDAVREDMKARLFARLRPIYPPDMLDSTWQIVEEVVFDGAPSPQENADHA